MSVLRDLGWLRAAGGGAVLSGVLALLLMLSGNGRVAGQTPASSDAFNDSHFHLTNHIQRGITAQQFLKIMGSRVSRSTLFGKLHVGGHR